MKRVKQILAFALVFILLVTVTQVTGFTVNAENESKETNVTSSETDVTASECDEEESKTDESESESSEAKEDSQTEESETEEDSKVEESEAEESYESDESKTEEESTEEETSEEETTTEEETTEEIIIEEETAKSFISEKFNFETEPITSIKYEVTVSGSDSETSFEWKLQTASWQEKAKTVELNGDGNYSFEFTLDYEEGLKNLGYVEPISDSEMTVTIDKIIVNGNELTYETAPVLKAGVENENGLANIWNVQPQVKICGDDKAYLALDKQDGAITFYAEKVNEDKNKDFGASQRYVEAMGSGWNLGNSFDGFEADLDKEDNGELAWGNPKVTRELLTAVKEKGYDSIRIPFTIHRRYTVNENVGEDDYKYVINESWLRRYKEVVDWAVDEGFYVMINIHHDSWIWLKQWDGDKSSEEYRMYTDFWNQLAEYMADEPEQVCFETINEPDFVESGELTPQQKLDEINRTAYDIIRGTEGNEKRMIVMPTILTNYEKGAPLYRLIEELDDENIIATVHYYSEWVYSANLGKTSFDEELWKNNGESYTPRNAVDNFMNTINKQFISNGIGVIVGEYGLLGYDASEGCLETGEELKYYEYMNEIARQNKVCLMFWDNGSGINRRGTLGWKKTLVGEMLENSMEGRSSYATGLDNLYFKEEIKEDVEIKLTLNGNTFVGINGLTEGTDYTYDSTNATVCLKKEYVNSKLAQKSGYGTFAELVMKFSSGADWHEYLVKYDTPVIGHADGSREGIKIPVDFKGSRVRRISAYQSGGKVGPNSDWWDYLKYDGSFGVDYENGTINLLSDFFADATVKDGLVKLKVEFYDGEIVYISLTVDGNKVSSSKEVDTDVDNIDASEIICLYTGEQSIPSQYLYMPEGGSVYGTWVDESENQEMITLEGWPSTIKFDTKAHDNFVSGGILLCYMNIQKNVDVKFGIKDAPAVEDLEINDAESRKLVVSNLADDAKITYKSSDTSIADVDEDGTVIGKKSGNAVITVTVEQYNRSDDFEAKVTVKSNSDSQEKPGTSEDESDNNGQNEQSQTSGDSAESNTNNSAKADSDSQKSSVTSESKSDSSNQSQTVTSSVQTDTNKQEVVNQEIQEVQIPTAQQPTVSQTAESNESVKQSKNLNKSSSKKTDAVEDKIDETESETVTEVDTETATEDAVEEKSEVESSQVEQDSSLVDEDSTIVEDEAAPLASEELSKKNSVALPFIITGIVVVIGAAGAAIIYFKRKKTL